jgi:hypothetical protein
MPISHRQTGEKIGFGSKTENFLRKKSRQAVENYSDTCLLYFEVDYARSKKNLYGELLVKEWVDPNGIQLYGNIEITEDSQSDLERIPFKLLQLKFSCFVEHLKEVGIMPQIGNYFATKNELYYIHDKSLLDSNKHSINTDNEAISIEFYCTQIDDETIYSAIIDNQITANEIFGRDQKLGVFL